MQGQRVPRSERRFETACGTGAASFRLKAFMSGIKARRNFRYERKDAPVLFMAGCYNWYEEDQERFVIITTEANSSVAPVHNRMPLILEPEELKDWVLDDGATEYLLHKTPVLLEAHAEYEQMRLF